MKCPKCNSKNYSFKKTKKGTTWTCKDCGFKKTNKTAEQLLKEDPIKGSLKRTVEKLEKQFDNKDTKNKKEITAKETIEYIKSKTKKFKIIEKKEGFYQLMKKGDRKLEVIDRKKWLALYLKKNNFKVEKVYDKKQMMEIIDGIL
jgi:hypothetical protein